MTHRPFRFYKFEENEKTTSSLNFNEKTNFYNTNKSYNFKNQNYKTYNSFHPSNTNKLSNSMNLLNSQQNFNVQNNERTLHFDRNNIYPKSQFPLKEILNINFEDILNYGNLNVIQKLLPNILYYRFQKNQGSYYFPKIIHQFQLLLLFLFDLKAPIENSTNNLNIYLINPNSSINSRKERLKKKKNNNDNTIIINNEKIKEIQKKIMNFKNILITNGYNDKIPKTIPDFNYEQGNYFCEKCSNKKFNSYDEIHQHYIKEHYFNNIKGDIFISNNKSQEFYFNKEFNNIKNDLNKSIQQLNNNNYESQKIDELKKAIRNLNNTNQNNFNNLSLSINPNQNIQVRNSILKSYNNYNNYNYNNLDDINQKLDIISKEEENQFQEFRNQLQNFQIDIFKQLNNISENKKVSIPNVLIRKKKKLYNVSLKNGKTDLKEIPNKNNLRSSKFQNSSKDQKPLIKKEKTELDNYETNKNKYYLENIDEVYSDDENINKNNNEDKLKAKIKKHSYSNLFELREYYNERDKEILFNKNNQFKDIEANYNFLGLNIFRKYEKAVQEEINNISQEFNIDLNDYSNLKKDDFKILIEQITKKNKKETDNYYSKYRDNLYSLNKIEDICIENNLHIQDDNQENN